MENMKGYYAQDCGPASHNQAMIADENDDKGRTVAVVYDREKARQIVKACNEYEDLTLFACDLMDALENSISLKSGEFFGLRERFRNLIQAS